MLADIDGDGLNAASDRLTAQYGQDVVCAVVMNVTSEAEIAAAFQTTVLEFGGSDIVVSNAGIASSAPIEETTLALWNKNFDILSTGYFLVSRAAFITMRAQALGGAVVFVASKNRLVQSQAAGIKSGQRVQDGIKSGLSLIINIAICN